MNCQQEKCSEEMNVLSYFDQVEKYDGPVAVEFHRTTKWKCINGHRTDTYSIVDAEKKFIRKVKS